MKTSTTKIIEKTRIDGSGTRNICLPINNPPGHVFVPTTLCLKCDGEGELLVVGVMASGQNLISRIQGSYEPRIYGLRPGCVYSGESLRIQFSNDDQSKTISGRIDGYYMSESEYEEYVSTRDATEDPVHKDFPYDDISPKRLCIAWFDKCAETVRLFYERWRARREVAEDRRRDLMALHVQDVLRDAVIDAINLTAFPVRALLQLTSKSIEDLEMLTSRKSSTIRDTLFHYPSTIVRCGESTRVEIQMIVCFTPHSLVIPKSIQKKFQIGDIKVGRNSQLYSTIPIPATDFSTEDGLPIPLRMDRAKPSDRISLSITNIGDSDEYFSATLIGTLT